MTMQMQRSRINYFRKLSGNDGNIKGFTLVELIVVVAILGVLAMMSVSSYTEYVKNVKNARAISEVLTIDKDIQAYYIDKNTYPPNLAAINRGTLKDPWGQLYVYNLTAVLNNSLGLKLNPSLDYDLYSKGANTTTTAPAPDCASTDTCFDDIVRADDGSSFALRNKY